METFHLSAELLKRFESKQHHADAAVYWALQDTQFANSLNAYFTSDAGLRKPLARPPQQAFERLDCLFQPKELDLLEQFASSSAGMPAIQHLGGKFHTNTAGEDWHLAQERPEASPWDNILLTLSYIFSNPSKFHRLELNTIVSLHALLFDGSEIAGQLRTQAQPLPYTAYNAPETLPEIHAALLALIDLVNRQESPFNRAIAIAVGIGFVQPFQDGNKRVAAMLCNAILIAHRKRPISQEAIPPKWLLKSFVYFYERQDPAFAKYLFLRGYLDGGSDML
jgi:fido (protein-threonine AMPylation protein)